MRAIGPTRNPSYNRLLAQWKSTGDSCEPACEGCEVSLIGKMVYETDCGWYCKKCSDDLYNNPVYIEPREDFHSDG